MQESFLHCFLKTNKKKPDVHCACKSSKQTQEVNSCRNEFTSSGFHVEFRFFSGTGLNVQFVYIYSCSFCGVKFIFLCIKHEKNQKYALNSYDALKIYGSLSFLHRFDNYLKLIRFTTLFHLLQEVKRYMNDNKLTNECLSKHTKHIALSIICLKDKKSQCL